MKVPSILFLVSILAIAVFAAQTPTTQTLDHKAPNPKVIQYLQEIVQIRERAVKSVELLHDAGRGPAFDDDAEVALAEAQIELAREQQHTDRVIAGLEKIVSIKETQIERIKARLSDHAHMNLNAEHLDLLRAKIRLERARAEVH